MLVKCRTDYGITSNNFRSGMFNIIWNSTESGFQITFENGEFCRGFDLSNGVVTKGLVNE